MHMDKVWWFKKNPALYLLDIAILLAILQNVDRNSYFTHPNPFNDAGENIGPVVQFLPTHSYFQNDLITNLKVHRLLNESSVRHTAISTLNITAHMVLVSPLDIEENVSVQHATLSESVTDINQELFDLDELCRPSDFSNVVSAAVGEGSPELLYSLDNFSFADDVRWRQYLNADQEQITSCLPCTSSVEKNDCNYTQTCSSSNSNDKVVKFIVSNFSDISYEKKSSFQSKSAHFFDLMESNFTNSINSTSGTFFKSFEFSNLHLNQPTNNMTVATDEDADLMQILYEQDADLGYNWHRNSNFKQLKDVDDVQLVKPTASDLNDFFVDGETGEQIPISRTANTPAQNIEPPNFFQNQVSPINPDTTSLNIDECLEMLEQSMDDIQPRKPSSQNSVDECNAVVQNLTSLLEPSENSSLQTQSNPNLWQQIDELAELTGLNLQEVGQPIVSQQQKIQEQQQQQQIPSNGFTYNRQVPAPTSQHAQLNHQFVFTPIEINNFDQSSSPSSVFNNQFPQSYSMQNIPTSNHNSPVQTPPNYVTPPPMLSDDGIPMETSFIQIETSSQQNHGYPADKFNDFGYQIESSLPADNCPGLASLSEPGQGFFDYLQQDSNVGDIGRVNQTSTIFSSQSTSPFLNPPVTTYSPPPLNTTPIGGIFMEEREQQIASGVNKNRIAESYESDSGISLDHSPQGLELINLNCTEETVYNNDFSVLKTEPDTSEQEQGFHFSELRGVQHNHTYNGTAGVKKDTKKNLDKSPTCSSRESRDEKKARDLNLPFSLDEIILSPVEEYNEMLARTPLNPAQQALVKDIRRRGKNKVAAQNCRKRKIETITNMEEDVDRMRHKKHQLVDEQKDLEIKYESLKLQYSALYQQIFSSLRDDTGRPYDPELYRLEQVEGAVLLVPHRRNDGNDQGASSSGAGVDFSKVKFERS